MHLRYPVVAWGIGVCRGVTGGIAVVEVSVVVGVAFGVVFGGALA